ncbi:hypothetical protein EVJ20_07490 [Exiguobacterium sp. SH0S1]|uniref:CgeB family protein n=1 Tax=Exiguobacterium sp. SH0S1 TaxID=2510949 RepID=UPI001039784F|nr:glycosyltransferase [Exiguobacterium sp. SH0S1]TCI77795.1 hypothetical protein EVJ20_07490 [Exiguobacterium sp. SH0S1]
MNTTASTHLTCPTIFLPERFPLAGRVRTSETVQVDGDTIIASLGEAAYQYIELTEAPIPVLGEMSIVCGFEGEVSSPGGIDLVVEVKATNGVTKRHIVEAGEARTLQFGALDSSFTLKMRLNGAGSYTRIEALYQNIAVLPDERISLPIDARQWYGGAYNANYRLHDEDGVLHASVNLPSGKKKYISFRETNNNYALLPDEPFAQVTHDGYYEFSILGSRSPDIDVMPMLVGYESKTKRKVEIVNLMFNGVTRVRPNRDVDTWRLALNVKGQGTFTIREVQLSKIEEEISVNNQEKEWVNDHEAYQTGYLAPRELGRIKIGVIMDKFTFENYRLEADLLPLHPDYWKEQIMTERPDLVFIESAWEGNNGLWNKKIGYYGETNAETIRELVAWCKSRNIPTVFWNKEDPVHYARFIETAKLVDIVMTTDENRVPSYQTDCGHERVYALPFAGQPKLQNPISLKEGRIPKACFAGSYYSLHEERARDMDRLLRVAKPYGLTIYDRNYEKNQFNLMPNHRFPAEFEDDIEGVLEFYEIDKAYKGYKIMLNINTVKQSPTMFSRRVFEGLLCGTPIISTYSLGVEQMFGELVSVTEDEAKMESALKELMTDEAVYHDKQVRGIREVLEHHTYEHRLTFILDKADIPYRVHVPSVAVVQEAQADEVDRIVEQFKRQTYEAKTLYLIVEASEDMKDLYKRFEQDASIQVYWKDSLSKYQTLGKMIGDDYVTSFNAAYEYGGDYLKDLMLATKYSTAEIIGKASYMVAEAGATQIINEDSEFSYVPALQFDKAVAKMNIFLKEAIDESVKKITTGQSTAEYGVEGYRMLSIDNQNLKVHR